MKLMLSANVDNNELLKTLAKIDSLIYELHHEGANLRNLISDVETVEAEELLSKE